ncbi:MAG TPA: 50S ribosomal protein L24 [Verrucomicrobiae bacterium]|jgi:large subunit ribosomal protein L24|nr:50S ribosomal protein L24 [Verrucomicrobiae bacterium]
MNRQTHTAHVKKGDEVVVISGTEKGKRGRVIQVLRRKQRAIVEGVKMIKRHTRKNQQHPNGAIVEREGTVHLSNLMLAERFDARAAKRSQPAPA